MPGSVARTGRSRCSGSVAKKGLGASGKAVETGVGRIGFHAGHGSLVDAVYPLLAQDLSDNLLQRFPGRGDLFENHFLAVRYPSR